MNEFEKLATAKELIEKQAAGGAVGSVVGAASKMLKPVTSYVAKKPMSAAWNALGAGFIGYEVGNAFASGAGAGNQGRIMGAEVGPQTM